MRCEEGDVMVAPDGVQTVEHTIIHTVATALLFFPIFILENHVSQHVRVAH